MIRLFSIAALGGLLSVSACAPSGDEEFWTRLNALCGNAYAGELVSSDPQDAEFAGADIWMDVTDCQPDQVTVDFMRAEEAIGHWVISRNDGQMELRHIHEGDPLTGYGGFSADNASGSRLNFPADQMTKDLFEAQNIPASMENVWAIEVRPTVFRYEMARPNRFFQVEFDTTTPISAD